ncbi:helix-turn-helix domain-containing protein [Stenotrophomonas sp. JC08]|uniref:helix-turn-helix domain-containing protein n=1 Tax=Stenotrophomonas sp. JC08 TaxID=3445779 RepID=UPI003FA2D695
MTKLVYNNIFDAITQDASQAADLQFRADMLLMLRDMFEERTWGQAEIMKALDIPQPRVSELVNGKIDKFSSDKLIGFLDKMGYRMRPRLVTKQRSKTGHVRCDVQELEVA